MKKAFIDEYLTIQLRQKIDELVDHNLDLDSILSLLSNDLYGYEDYMLEQVKRYVMYVIWLADKNKNRKTAFEKYKKHTNQVEPEPEKKPKTKKTSQTSNDSLTADRFFEQLRKDRKRIDEISNLKRWSMPTNSSFKPEASVKFEPKKDVIDEILETLTDEELQKTLTDILTADKTSESSSDFNLNETELETKKDDESSSENQEAVETNKTETFAEQEDNHSLVEDSNLTTNRETSSEVNEETLKDEEGTAPHDSEINEQIVEPENEVPQTEAHELINDESEEKISLDSQEINYEEPLAPIQLLKDEALSLDQEEISDSNQEKDHATNEEKGVIIDEDKNLIDEILETLIEESEKPKDKIDEILDSLSDEEVQATLSEIINPEKELADNNLDPVMEAEKLSHSTAKDESINSTLTTPTFSKRLADITFEDVVSDPSIAANQPSHTLFEVELEDDNGTQTLDDSIFLNEKEAKKMTEKSTSDNEANKTSPPSLATEKALAFVDEIAQKYGTDTLVTMNIKKHDLTTKDLTLAEPLKTLKVGGIIWYKGREYMVEKIEMEIDFFHHEQLMLVLKDLTNHEEIKINAKKIK